MEKEPKQPLDLYKFIYPIAKLALDHKYRRTVVNPENILDRPAIYAANQLPYSIIPGLKNKADHLMQVVENRVADQTGMSQTGAYAVLRRLRNLNNRE